MQAAQASSGMTASVWATIVVGISSGFFVYLTAKEGRKHASLVAEQTARWAREQSLHGKRCDAYARILQLAYEVQGNMAQAQEALSKAPLEVELPDFDSAKWAELNAVLMAYQTPGIKSYSQEWLKHVRSAQAAITKYALRVSYVSQQSGTYRDPAEAFNEFVAARAHARVAYEKLAEAVNRELESV